MCSLDILASTYWPDPLTIWKCHSSLRYQVLHILGCVIMLQLNSRYWCSSQNGRKGHTLGQTPAALRRRVSSASSSSKKAGVASNREATCAGPGGSGESPSQIYGDMNSDLPNTFICNPLFFNQYFKVNTVHVHYLEVEPH